MPNPPLSEQMRMGQSLRRYISFNPLNYLRPAERLQTPARVLYSDVDLTDVSFYQKLIDFGKMKAAGARGTIIRAGQNLWEDPYFDINWQNAKKEGLPRGSYYFFDSRVTPKAQADLYWSLIKYDQGELMAVADYEESYGGPYGGWRNLYDFQERLLSNGLPVSRLWIYSGYYYWLDHSPQSVPASLAYFAKFPLWLAWYTTNPANVKIPKPWTAATTLLWQWGTPTWGAKYGVQTSEIDMDKWTGDLHSYTTYFDLGGTTPPPPPSDITAQPFNGVTYIKGTRFGRPFYLTISDPTKVRFEVVHAQTPDLLEQPSAVARRKGAQLAFNGGEWDKHNQPYLPRDLSVSNGKTYVPRKDFVPSLIFFQDGRVTIAHTDQPGQYNVASGLRYLVENGVMKDYLNHEEIQYIERRGRSIEGIDRNGHVMRLTVDGVYPAEGVQLKEAAAIMLEFGARVAFDTSGGGDSTIAINGVTQNVPEDIIDGHNVERRVPEFLLGYVQDTTTMPRYKLTNTSQDKTLRIRSGPSVMFNPTTLFIPVGGSVNGDFLMTFKADLTIFDRTTQKDIVIGKVGDQWVHLANDSGWSAYRHMGVLQGALEVLPDTTPAPDVIASVTTTQEMTVTHADGRVETFRASGVNLPRV